MQLHHPHRAGKTIHRRQLCRLFVPGLPPGSKGRISAAAGAGINGPLAEWSWVKYGCFNGIFQRAFD